MMMFRIVVVLVMAALSLAGLRVLHLALTQPPQLPSAGRRRAGNILIGVAGGIMLFSGCLKLVHVPMVVVEMSSLSLGSWKLSLIGSLELMSGLLLLSPVLRSLGLLVASAYLGGGICAHLQSGQYFAMLPTAIVLGASWLGAMLRHPQILWSLAERGRLPLLQGAAVLGVLVAGGMALAQSAGAETPPAAKVEAHQVDASQVDGLITKQSTYPVDRTIERFEAELRSRGFVVFTHLDHAAAAKAIGLDMPRATVIVFGNPKIGPPNFLKHPTLAIDLPMKALVWQDASGKVWLSYNSQKYLDEKAYARHGAPIDNALADRIETTFAAISDAATK